MSDGYKEMAASREHWDAQRDAEIESLRSRLAEADALLREVQVDGNIRPELFNRIAAHLSRKAAHNTLETGERNNLDDSADIKSCVHCASERISLLTFDVWECEDCGREFTFGWKPSSLSRKEGET